MRILTTNPQPQNDRLAALFRARGADVVQLPLHRVDSLPEGVTQIRALLANVEAHGWMVVASRNAVDTLQQAVLASGSPFPKTLRVAAMGPATAMYLRTIQIKPTMVGDGGGDVVAKQILREAKAHVMVLQAKEGRTDWHERFAELGVQVTCIATHVLVPLDVERSAWTQGTASFDAILFTAPTAVRRFMELFGHDLTHGPWMGAHYYAIGDRTAGAMHEAGLPIQGFPPQPDFGVLAEYVMLTEGTH